MAKQPLGRLESVDLREYWQHEATEFTPWLASADNLGLLSEALNIDLELKSIEAGVGPFSADIVCRDLGDDSIVLVENQIEKTDHKHLGQILTYAAGFDAMTLVWIARNFTEEHRAAIDWFNRVTTEGIKFFGVAVELWRIGSSVPAPRFHVVAKPNDWSKAVRVDSSSGETAGARLLYFDYWQGFVEHLRQRGSRLFRNVSPRRAWVSFGLGTSGFRLVAAARVQRGWVAASLIIGTPRAKEYFAALHEERDAIEQELGDNPKWVATEGTKRCKVRFEMAADLNDRDSWPRLYEWQLEKLETLDKVFRVRVARLKATDGNATDEDDE